VAAACAEEVAVSSDDEVRPSNDELASYGDEIVT
jgi:hypothetical protein